MSNELTTVKAENWLALSGAANGVAEAQAASGETVSLGGLTWVRTPSGGGTVWEIEDGMGGSEATKEITGIMVLYRKRSILWPTEGEPQEGAKPLLVCDDHPKLEVARRVGDDFGDLDPELIECCRREDGLYDVRPKSAGGSFYYSEFGSSGKGPGPRMKEQRIIGILRETDVFPILVVASPGSITAVKNVVARFTKPYYQMIVRLSLQKATSASGIAYAQIRMQVAGQLTDEQRDAVAKAYWAPLNQAFESGRMIEAE